ncbi:glycosyltransferase family 2 protein [Prevotella fusca]
MLSILLPVYNCSCVALVTELHRQCVECKADFEIIVADDGSLSGAIGANAACQHLIDENKVIEHLKGVRYIIREKNVGRSAIRNFLVSQAKGERLLFIDGDLSLDNPSFIRNYLQTEADVVVGGIAIGGSPDRWKGNLRYRYERKCETINTVESRQRHPYQHLATNILVRHSVLGEQPYDENISHYGYEDVLLGKRFQQQQVAVRHIDNPVLFCDFEDNASYLAKTEEALRTLFAFRKELKGYSRLLDKAERIETLHLTPFFIIAYKLLSSPIKNCLLGNKPNVFWFNVYKLLYYLHYAKNAI